MAILTVSPPTGDVPQAGERPLDVHLLELPSRLVVKIPECAECRASRAPGWIGSLVLELDNPGQFKACSGWGDGYDYVAGGYVGCPNTGRAALALLEFLSAANTHPSRAALALTLSRPAWQRALERIAAPADTRYVLQLRPEDGRVRAAVATATAKKRAPGFVLKRCPLLPADAPTGVRSWHAAVQTENDNALVDAVLEAAARGALFVAGSDQPWPCVEETGRLTTRKAKLGDRFGVGLALRWGNAAPVPLPQVAGGLRYHGVSLQLGEAEVRVLRLPDEVRSIFAGGLETLVVPRDALAQLVRRLVHVGAPLALPEETSGDALAVDARPVLRVEWRRPALTVSLGLHLHDDYPVLRPCEAPEVLYVSAPGSDRLAHITRDFDGERRMVEAFADRLGLPADTLTSGVTVPLEQLAPVMAALRAVSDSGEARLEWQTAAPRVAIARPEQVAVTITPSGRDWFGIEGTVQVENGVPLALVLAAIRDRQTYVALGDDHFVLLSDALTEALTPLAATAEPPARKGATWRVGRVGAAAVAAADTGLGFDAPEAWLNLAQRVTEAARLEPEVPAGLQAELRHYQADGVRWLLRLQHWAPGALLADDMGLGKTVQAIALLLARAAKGPTLVVAPTSVGFNWLRELERFAPSLERRAFRGGANAAALDGLGPSCVVVTSYDLVAGYLDRFEPITWGTVVLDEAQAIKNATTQRAQAAASLRADFRLALSGTPIENRPEELWSLFNATVPGLLGSLVSFKERFGAAGQAHGTRHARMLSRVVRPFVLRRLKREVAQELPARTEIGVEVTLTDGERALYDKIRRAAVQALTAGTPAPQLRFQVLAAITRLRQAACHPRLVDPASPLPSSKLAALLERIDELRAEGHRALVFSQFTSHLALVREALDARQVRYRYLDGSTPATQRRLEVDAFQAGQGDVFLLSLKAGGTGLNLTAADYVIHLDPWWNPAVEDQATDRAHRIGQTRPVTVYRLIAKDTLEERILALHADKRELVATVLDGTGDAGALSTDELMALLDPQADVPAAEAEVVDSSAPAAPKRPRAKRR